MFNLIICAAQVINSKICATQNFLIQTFYSLLIELDICSVELFILNIC